MALQRNERPSIVDLSREIGLSQTRKAERFRRMEEAKVIRGYSAEVDRESAGLPILAYIRITCGGSKYKPFLAFIATAEPVQECHHSTGGECVSLEGCQFD